MKMNHFAKLIILLFLTSSLHLSASGLNRTDTIQGFNEVTDIELLIKKATSDAKEAGSHGVVLQDTILLVGDTISTHVALDSFKVVEIAAVTPTEIRTSLDSVYNRKENGTLELPQQVFPYELYLSSLNFRDTMLYNPLFVPVVFTGRIEVPDSISFYPQKDDKLKNVLISSDNTFAPYLEKQTFVDKVRRHYYLEHPSSVKLSTSSLSGLKQTVADEEVSRRFNPFKELLSSETSYSLDKPNVEGIEIGRVYWVKTGEHSLQFSQNYFSPNWHRGGTSNLNINSNHILNLNYEKDKIKFNNRLEWRLSVYNAPDDTLRNYRIGDDMVRYYGDFGHDAFIKSWSYSTNLEVKTQLFKSYKANEDELRSAFLSPLYVNAGIGMKYHIDKRSKTVRNRRLRLDVSISPLSVNYRYVGNNEVDRKRYGIPEGDKSLFDKGSTLTSNMTYDFTKYISWKSRLKYFTNYGKVEAELENTLTMSLTQMFSTTIYLNLRFDDSVPAHDDYKYLQVNEVVSFGLNYKW